MGREGAGVSGKGGRKKQVGIGRKNNVTLLQFTRDR